MDLVKCEGDVRTGLTVDLLLGAGVQHVHAGLGVVAGVLAVGPLQQAGVADAQVGRVGRLDADAAGRLLEDGGEDEARVQAGVGAGLLDGGLDRVVLGVRVGVEA